MLFTFWKTSNDNLKYKYVKIILIIDFLIKKWVNLKLLFYFYTISFLRIIDCNIRLQKNHKNNKCEIKWN